MPLWEAFMRVWIIVLSLLAFWLGSRIADNPLVGLVVGAIVATVLLLSQRVLHRRGQASPPKRP